MELCVLCVDRFGALQENAMGKSNDIWIWCGEDMQGDSPPMIL
jgi:hypothetical protein